MTKDVKVYYFILAYFPCHIAREKKTVPYYDEVKSSQINTFVPFTYPYHITTIS